MLKKKIVFTGGDLRTAAFLDLPRIRHVRSTRSSRPYAAPGSPQEVAQGPGAIRMQRLAQRDPRCSIVGEAPAVG